MAFESCRASSARPSCDKVPRSAAAGARGFVSSEAYEYPDAALHKLSERMRWSVGVIEEALAAQFSLGRGSERRQSISSASHTSKVTSSIHLHHQIQYTRGMEPAV